MKKGKKKSRVHKDTQVLQKGDTAEKESKKANDTQDEGLSLLEKVKKETAEWGPGRGKKREIARMAYGMWLSLPVRYRGAPDAVLNSLGLSGDMLDLARIGSVRSFGEISGVSHQALADWGREFEESEQGRDHRTFFKKLMRDGLGALYRKLIATGNAEEFKVFAQYVEGWMPGINLGAPGDVNDMDVERRAALDTLIRKNKQKNI